MAQDSAAPERLIPQGRLGGFTMPPAYHVAQIRPDQFDRAYVLIQALAPALDLEAWRRACRESLSHHRSDHQSLVPGSDRVIVAANALGHIHGLCIATPLTQGGKRLLDVPIFVALSAMDEFGVAGEMMNYLKSMAATEACEMVRIWPLESESARPPMEAIKRAWGATGAVIPPGALSPDQPADEDDVEPLELPASYTLH